jgi:oxygen-dependent protoporphyrinogen oxidase
MGPIKRVVIVGGGITGLSAAYYLQQLAKKSPTSIEITLVEKSSILGGKIQTIHRDGFVIEKGPDSFLARKLPIIELTRDLNLEDQLVSTNPKAKKTYILHKGKLHRMPPGLVLGIPTEITPFLKTGLISPKGKLRAAMDLVLPRRTDPMDESLGHFLQRRLGKEILDNIAEPLLAGIYAGDTLSLSLKATFPQFHSTEQKYRSLILGMMANRKGAAEESGQLPMIARNSMFLSYKDGLETLVKHLEKALTHGKGSTQEKALSHVELFMNQRVTRIVKTKDVREARESGDNANTGVNKSQNGAYQLFFEDGTEKEVDAVIFTTPPIETGGILEQFSPTLPLASLTDIPYVSVANVIIAFDEEDITFNMDGSGFVVPRKEGRFITACTWTSSKWLHTAPKGKVLLRCYIGRSGEEDWMNLSNREILKRTKKDLKELMGIDATPLFYEINHWKQAMPQYTVGHLDRLKHLNEVLSSSNPGIIFTGSGYYGVGIPDCIRQGKEAAIQTLHFLKERS